MPRRKPKTRHGATQPEDARAAKAVLLRLRPEVIDSLGELAESWGATRSETVSRAVLGALGRCIEPRCTRPAALHERCRYHYEAWSDTSGT